MILFRPKTRPRLSNNRIYPCKWKSGVELNPNMPLGRVLRFAFRNVVFICKSGLPCLASLLLFLLAASATQGANTPAFVQEKDKQINSGTKNAVAFSNSTTAGNLIVVYLIWDNTGTVAVTDSLGNSYASATAVARWS